ncbi:SMP-30/gluconolactonase/LRE family protein [Henriciella pelagia]|jgi:sugar lactone lactonase YvrE|uniref:Gluconolaconase n=1 Tax=Henriciella pelagia TaxID=1977912 RepID=A0ABQ1JB68_9PROT|nr:SMP-30/gluconolactonase/LRE family protein [Henriciella pelagia]GGB62124.1 gluconolaconase [Henriciella pelagia]
MHLFEPQCVAPTSCLLGQSPVWSPSEGLLWWVDPNRAKLHRYNPKTGNARRYDLPLKASVIALSQGELLMAGEVEVGFFDPSTEEYTRLITLENEAPGNRINAGGVAPDGSFWFATMDGHEADARSAWYRLAPDRSIHPLNVKPIVIPSTACFSPDGSVFYTCDTTEQEIHAFDVEEGARLTNRRIFTTTSSGAGYPDGSTVDSEGHLWNAEWDGARIVRYTPEGAIDRAIKLPVSRITGCCFGDRDLKTLYVTTARTGLTAFQLDMQPFAGSLFAIRTDIAGRPCAEWSGR